MTSRVARPGTEVGPLVSDEQAAHVRALVEEAVAAGAALHCGGPGEGRFFAPADTVLLVTVSASQTGPKTSRR